MTEAAESFTIFLNTGEFWILSVDVPVKLNIEGSTI
jgi:hypothetical protein